MGSHAPPYDPDHGYNDTSYAGTTLTDPGYGDAPGLSSVELHARSSSCRVPF
jgi:hypothetical protein